VSDPHPARVSPEKEDKRTFLQKIAEFIHPGPDSKAELIETLADAEDNDIIGADSRVMLEGVIRMAELSAGDVMVAAPRMDLINIDSPYDEILHIVIDTAHSRFPVVEGDRENIIGILLAKDLLKLQRAPELNIRALLRPAVFVPETKALNDLLREFRGNRNHLAIVIDEFGRVAGLITIEDVLEQIVGEIEDEFDFDETEANIILDRNGQFRVKAQTEIEDFNRTFGTDFSDEDFDTVGGLVLSHLGRLPKRGEQFRIGDLNIKVVRADSRRLHALLVEKVRTESAA
jgi:magnesium and cobalt transporter